MKLGYARVSTEDQELGRQIKALQEYGCDRIFQEKISGGKISRPELDILLQTIQPGDTLVVIKLDRLGRSMLHLLRILDNLKSRGIYFRSLGDSFDTNTAQGTLMFQMLGAFAEFERALITERINDGLAYAKSQGIKSGRRPRIDRELVRLLYTEGMTPTAISRELKCSRQTVYEIKASPLID